MDSSVPQSPIVGTAKCFNSLQTGKSFWTCNSMGRRQRPLQFQFPSNGKVLLDTEEGRCRNRQDNCFNSLQTGKSFWTNKELLSPLRPVSVRFNSLQTGKSFWTKDGQESAVKTITVSIPFKRESPFGHDADRELLSNTVTSFNSLQTGKSFWTGLWRAKPKQGKKFQFPSNGKVLLDSQLATYWRMDEVKFQFPSNGKVLLDLIEKSLFLQANALVSIPFKRESPFGRNA